MLVSGSIYQGAILAHVFEPPYFIVALTVTLSCALRDELRRVVLCHNALEHL